MISGNNEEACFVASIYTDDPHALMPEDLIAIYLHCFEAVAVRRFGFELLLISATGVDQMI